MPGGLNRSITGRSVSSRQSRSRCTSCFSLYSYSRDRGPEIPGGKTLLLSPVGEPNDKILAGYTEGATHEEGKRAHPGKKDAGAQKKLREGEPEAGRPNDRIGKVLVLNVP